MTQLQLKDYSSLIDVNEKFVPTPTIQISTEQVVDDLLKILLQEPGAPKNVQIPQDYASKRGLVRGLLNIRDPKPIEVNFG